jgi:hypothetical protein
MRRAELGSGEEAEPEPERQRRSRVWVLLGGLVLGGLLVVGLGRVASSASGGLWGRLAGALLGRTTQIDVSAPAVVERIRQLSRLETVEYSIDKIVEGERHSLMLPNFLVGDKMLLVAHGEVIAGVDLGQLKDGDVAVKGDAVRVRLPNAQVLTTRIDNQRTKVYSRTTGVLVAADPDLESEVRKAAEEQIAEAAVKDGILEKAGVNARGSVGALLKGLGFKTVEVQ